MKLDEDGVFFLVEIVELDGKMGMKRWDFLDVVCFSVEIATWPMKSLNDW